MVDDASVNADRIRKYEFAHGRKRVEEFLDAVLSIEEHVDPHQRLRRRRSQPERGEEHQRPPGPYDDLIGSVHQAPTAPRKLPQRPEKDVLLFLAEHAPDLEDWQRDLIEIVREEMLYFVPQMQTKIMNEGWASSWHAQIMRELDLDDQEYVQFAQMHAGVLAPSKRELNPYFVGFKMFEDLERRLGRERIFEIRELESDVSFLRNYLTDELVDDLDLYIYKVEGDELVVVERDWEKIRDMIVGGMTNFGVPYVVVEDGDYRKARELYLRHVYEEREIDIAYADRVLRYVHQIWGRPVHLETVLDGEPVVLSFDGQENGRRAA